MRALLEEFRDVFFNDSLDIECVKNYECFIDTENKPPVYVKPYRLPNADREIAEEMVKQLLASDVIEESSSPYCSPTLLVNKANGNKRLVVDFRRLHKNIKMDRYLSPSIEECLNRLEGSPIFTTLDESSGFFQIPLVESSKEKTTFLVANKNYQFKRMPFGPCNAPSVQQRLLDRVLLPAALFSFAYLDDTIIHTKTDLDTHISQLRAVLSLLKEAGIKLNAKICHFGKSELDFLGFRVTKKGILPHERRVKAIKDFPKPSNLKSLRGFIGLTSFYRKFVNNYCKMPFR